MRKLYTEQDVNRVAEERFCLIYARSTSQNMVDYQIRVCEEYAELKGYTVVGEVVDREGYDNQMEVIEEALNGGIDVVVTFDFTRVSRDAMVFLSFRTILQGHGVDIEQAISMYENDQKDYPHFVQF